MNIAIITTEYPPHNNTGGIATFMAGLATLLKNQGHRVTVFADLGASINHEATHDDITVVPFIDLCKISWIKTLVLSPLGNLTSQLIQRYAPVTAQLIWTNLRTFLTFRDYWNHDAIHVIHTPVLFAPGYLISLIYRRIPLVTHAQGPDELLQPYNTVTKDSRLKAWIETTYMKYSRYIVVCSKSVTEYLKNKYHSIAKKLIYIPNFIDTGSFRTPKTLPNTNTLLFIGRLEYRKGPDLVAAAFLKLTKQYPKMKLIFLGEDTNAWTVDGQQCLFSDYLTSLKVPISVRRRIIFVPRIDERSSLITYLTTQRGIAVLPSRYEPFGFVYIEAMMAGCITIASKEGGGSEIIHNGIDGFTINPTVESIVMHVRKIKHLQKQQLLRIVMSAKENIHNKYDVSRVADAYRSLYNQIKSVDAFFRS